MQTLPALNLSTGLIPLVHDYLDATSLSDLAFKYNLSEKEVSDFLERKEVKSYIKNTLINSGYVNKKSRLDILNKIVDQKIAFSEDNDVPLSKKDILEVLKLLKDEEEMLVKNTEVQSESKGTYIQILNELKA